MSTAVASEIASQMYIDGTWCDAIGGKTLAVINPADESVLADVAYGTGVEAQRAVEAARRAHFRSGAPSPCTIARRS